MTSHKGHVHVPNKEYNEKLETDVMDVRGGGERVEVWVKGGSVYGTISCILKLIASSDK